MNNEFKQKVLSLYSEYSKVNGPYKRKDGREHVVLNKSELPNKAKGKLKTVSYPKVIMEVHLGRILSKDETVDHIDKDFLNNELNNLQVLSRSEHLKLDVIRRNTIVDCCVWCNKEITLTRDQLRKDKSGPFCSKSCSGKYGKSVQLGNPKLPNKKINVTYTTNKIPR